MGLGPSGTPEIGCAANTESGKRRRLSYTNSRPQRRSSGETPTWVRTQEPPLKQCSALRPRTSTDCSFLRASESESPVATPTATRLSSSSDAAARGQRWPTSLPLPLVAAAKAPAAKPPAACSGAARRAPLGHGADRGSTHAEENQRVLTTNAFQNSAVAPRMTRLKRRLASAVWPDWIWPLRIEAHVLGVVAGSMCAVAGLRPSHAIAQCARACVCVGGGGKGP